MFPIPSPAPGAVVVGIDGSPLSDVALRWAGAEAERRQAPLHLVHLVAAFPAVPGIGVVDFGEPEQLAGHILQEAAEKIRTAHPGLSVTTEVLMGPAAQALVRASGDAALLVVGARGHGRLTGLLVGSVSQQVAMHATCPVVVVRGEEAAAGAPVVAAVDGSEASRRALRFALDHAAATGAPVRVVHAEYVETPAGVPLGHWYGDALEFAKQTTTAVRALVEEAAGQVPEVAVELRVTHQEHPVAVLVEESARARLVVVASRGLGGFAGLLLGSVSQGVLSGAASSVAVVPAPAGGE